jgi:hypothetical protein
VSRAPVAPSDLPAACRTWDDRRRVWVPKRRYGSEREARFALGNDRRMEPYPCKASQVGRHWHLGHRKSAKR